ncbi:MAG: hypothetical protein IID28_07175, partial [Planctomycetes bacterium]|nr:hypothetical protein [Planctomycetota bacterium]
PMTAGAIPDREPVTALPTRRLVVTALVAAALTALGWAGVTALTGRHGSITAAASGAVLVAGISIGSLLLIRPWRPRALGTWANLWLAALVGRLLFTPALAYLLYSATQLSLTPLMLSIGVTYVVVQISEAAALAAHLNRISAPS